MEVAKLGNLSGTLAHIHGILVSVRVGTRIDPISHIQRWGAEMGDASHSYIKQPNSSVEKSTRSIHRGPSVTWRFVGVCVGIKIYRAQMGHKRRWAGHVRFVSCVSIGLIVARSWPRQFPSRPPWACNETHAYQARGQSGQRKRGNTLNGIPEIQCRVVCGGFPYKYAPPVHANLVFRVFRLTV